MYPDVSQMYLTCSVTFQENTCHDTCILTFCMYFTRIPNESKINFGIHIRYIRIHVYVSCMWDTSGIHAGYMRDTYGIHVSAEVRGYMEDTCGIHAGYMRDT